MGGRLRAWLAPLGAFTLGLVLWTMGARSATSRDLALELLKEAGISGGLVVQVGCGDGRLTAALYASDSFLVQGLDRKPGNVERARQYIKSLGLYGPVSVDLWPGGMLPYADNLVNLLVVDRGEKVSEQEVMRVLAPGGVALLGGLFGWRKVVKPWPKGMDEWTHYLHDSSNNAVSKDELVGPPKSLRWTAGPLYCRSHEYNSSVSALVTARGRLFYILDEGPIGLVPSMDPRMPDRWSLVCRDAFSGVLLWKRPIRDWGWKAWKATGLWSTPMTLPRRLVAVGDRVYVTLGYRAPLSELDAATGRVLRTFEGTKDTDEILYCDGLLVLRVRRIPEPGEKEGKGPEFVVALDPRSGRALWRREEERIVPLTLAAAEGRVCYHNFEQIVCLDLRTGRELWRVPCEPCRSRPRETAGTLVIYKGVVLYTSGEGLLALSLDKGERLWTGPRWSGFGATQPPDLLVADGLVWCPVRMPRIYVSNSESLNSTGKPIAVEAWVRPDSDTGVVIAKGGKGHGYSLFVKGGRPGFAVRIGGKMFSVMAKAQIPLGKWSHLVGVLTEDGRLQVFVNGELAGSKEVGSFLKGEPVEEIQLGVDEGGNVGPYGRTYFTGVLDEVRVYTGPVSPAEIRRHYLSPEDASVERARLVLRFSFDSGTARDESGNGNDGKMEGVSIAGGKVGLGAKFEASEFQRQGTAIALNGRDPLTGEVKRRIFVPRLISPKHHFRCYRSKATERFLLLPKRGVEFLDLRGEEHMRHDWLRGACSYGVMPANGLLYLPPHQCFCYPGVKLAGFLALSHGTATLPERSNPLERGPAYGWIGEEEPPDRDWPTYRHDPERSGFLPQRLPARLAKAWEFRLGGKLTPPVEAGGRLFVAKVEEHTLYCLDVETGRKVWEFTAGGRIDSPPTVWRGLVLFGCRDGWVYCLRSTDGMLAWRFRAAPTNRKVVAFGQLESAWPVAGSVLILDGVAYFAAGRSTFLDGGIHLYGLEPRTGKVLYKAHVEGPWPDVRKDVGRPFDMEGARADILVTDSDREHIYMFQMVFDRKLRPVEAPRITPLGARRTGLHLSATGGFLQGLYHEAWWDRTYWMYARCWPGYYFAYNAPKTGQILAFDKAHTYGLHVFNKRKGLSPYFIPGTGYELFCDRNDNEPYLEPKAVGWEKGPGYSRREPPVWSVKVRVRAIGLVLAGDKLLLCGPPDEVPPQDPLFHIEGRDGAKLWVVSAKDGSKLAEYELDAPPVFDGMIAARGRLFISTRDGRVVCLKGI